MPPTMILIGPSEAAAVASGLVPRHPATKRDKIRETAKDLRIVVSRGPNGRAPPEEPVLQQRDQVFGEQRDDRDDDHSGVDPGGVEGALGVGDQQAEAL